MRGTGMNEDCELGIIGLAVMGQNLALNIMNSGYRVAGYNRTSSVTRQFVKQRVEKEDFFPAYELEELVGGLRKPRIILLLVKAGPPVDSVIDDLIPLLDQEDIIIDGGNSYFKDTEHRYKKLADRGIRYLGTGVSGGEYGALHGPSLMPGGDRSAYDEVENILKDAAAKTKNGYCVSFLGPRSAGHYVKMIHNGIEYGIMEIIAEIYDIMHKVLSLKYEKMAALFAEWNEEHESYLMEISAEILEKKDNETKQPLLDVILDKAAQKGTGKWSAREGLNLGVPVPTITAGVKARYYSAFKTERQKISKKMNKEAETTKINLTEEDIIKVLGDALHVGTVITYVEGMKLLQAASKEYEYKLDLSEVARIWEDGCIIRSSHLELIQRAYKQHNQPENDGLDLISNLLMAPEVRREIRGKIISLRKLITEIKKVGIPLPALNGVLDYIDSFSSLKLPANMIQAQRDYFGAHSYERVDKKGTFHTEWQDIHNIT